MDIGNRTVSVDSKIASVTHNKRSLHSASGIDDMT